MGSRRKDLTLHEKVNAIEYAEINNYNELNSQKRLMYPKLKFWNHKYEKVSNENVLKKNLKLKILFLGSSSEERARNILTSELYMNQKDKDLARYFNIIDFLATNGCYCGWKEKEQIYFMMKWVMLMKPMPKFLKNNLLHALLQDKCFYMDICEETVFITELCLMRLWYKRQKKMLGKFLKGRMTFLCCNIMGVNLILKTIG